MILYFYQTLCYTLKIGIPTGDCKIQNASDLETNLKPTHINTKCTIYFHWWVYSAETIGHNCATTFWPQCLLVKVVQASDWIATIRKNWPLLRRLKALVLTTKVSFIFDCPKSASFALCWSLMRMFVALTSRCTILLLCNKIDRLLSAASKTHYGLLVSDEWRNMNQVCQVHIVWSLSKETLVWFRVFHNDPRS